jgi:hypothetical protein
VRWMGDIEMPAQGEDAAAYLSRTGKVLDFDPKLLETYNFPDAAETRASIRAMGFVVNGLDLTDIADKISGFSIVRAARDKQIYGQGIIYPVMDNGTISYPLAANKLTNDDKTRIANTYMYHSPEMLFGYDMGEFANGDSIRIEDYYASEGADMGKVHTLPNAHMYEKLYEQATPGSGSGQGQKGYIDSIKYSHLAPASEGVSLYNPDDPTRVYDPLAVVGVGSAFAGQMARTGAGQLFVMDTSNQLGDYGDPTNYLRPICSYVRTKDTLYGGQTDAAKANTEYMFCGHYQEVNTALYTANGNSWVLNNIDVFGGDAFVNIFDFARLIYDGRVVGFPPTPPVYGFSHGIIFPIESHVNTNLRKGVHLAKDRSYDRSFVSADVNNTSGVTIDFLNDSTVTHLESFDYEDAYSQDESSIFYPALPIDFVSQTRNGKIVRRSEVKYNGEAIDNFRRYLPNNFIEVDVRGGNITNLIFSNDMLFYLQNMAVGYLPVFERQVMSGSVGGDTQVGVGGILERYDQISNWNGSQHKFSLVKVPDGFIWFDMRRRTFMKMKSGAGIYEISTVKGKQAFFANAFPSGDILTNDNPVLGKGISGHYDERFGEVRMVFNNGLIGSFTNVYNNKKDHFSGDFSEAPTLAISCNGFYLQSTPRRPAIQNATAYAVGAEVTDTSNLSNYVCILAYTSAGPAIQPNADATHWTLVNSKNQAYVANKGTICKLFGLVYDNYLDFIISDGSESPIICDNVALAGNNVHGSENPFSDYLYSNSFQSASDLALDGTVANRDYGFRDRIWYSSIPNEDKARLIDNFLRLKIRKDNKLSGSLFNSKDKLTKIVSLTTWFRYAK